MTPMTTKTMNRHHPPRRALALLVAAVTVATLLDRRMHNKSPANAAIRRYAGAGGAGYNVRRRAADQRGGHA